MAVNINRKIYRYMIVMSMMIIGIFCLKCDIFAETRNGVPYLRPIYKTIENQTKPENGIDYELQDILGISGWESTNANNVTVIDSKDNLSGKTLSAGWYLFSGSVTANDTVKTDGSVNIILADGCDFRIDVTGSKQHGIDAKNGSLTIYGQSKGEKAGKLLVKGSRGIVREAEINETNITINGDNVICEGSGNGEGGYGIRLYNSKNVGSQIIINGNNSSFKGYTSGDTEGIGIYSSSSSTVINGNNIKCEGTRIGLGAAFGNATITINGDNLKCIGQTDNGSSNDTFLGGIGTFKSGDNTYAKININGSCTLIGNGTNSYVMPSINYTISDDLIIFDESNKSVAKSNLGNYKKIKIRKISATPYLKPVYKIIDGRSESANGIDYTWQRSGIPGWISKVSNAIIINDVDDLSGKTLFSGWYLLSGSGKTNNTVTVDGDVNIILADNCNFEINGSNKGIDVSSGSLTIWGQSKGNDAGKLSIKGIGITSGYGICSGGILNNSVVTVNADNIECIGSSSCGYAAGIFNGNNNSNLIVINGDKILCKGEGTGTCSGFGIRNYYGNSTTIVNGNNLICEGSSMYVNGSAYGIANSDDSVSNATTIVNGNNITCKGSNDNNDCYGIYNKTAGDSTVEINGNNVTLVANGKYGYGVYSKGSGNSNSAVAISGDGVVCCGNGTSTGYGIYGSPITINNNCVLKGSSQAINFDSPTKIVNIGDNLGVKLANNIEGNNEQKVTLSDGNTWSGTLNSSDCKYVAFQIPGKYDLIVSVLKCLERCFSWVNTFLEISQSLQ